MSDKQAGKLFFNSIERLYIIASKFNPMHPVSCALGKSALFLSEIFFRLNHLGLTFYKPHIFVDPDNEVVFEWAFDNRNLNIYFTSIDKRYLKAWGANIHNEMADGELLSIEQFIDLWQWLNKGEQANGQD